MARIALYLRVSTKDQATDNQRAALTTWAKNAVHEIVAVYEDAGISGAKTSAQRPAMTKLLKAAVRKEFDQVAV